MPACRGVLSMCLIVAFGSLSGLWPSATAAAPPSGAASASRDAAGPQAPSADKQQAYDAHVRPFLQRYCFSCHGEKVRKAGMRLDDLGIDFLAGKNADAWKEVIDRLNLGEMPPNNAGVPRPTAAESFAVVEWVGKELRRAERDGKMAGGRVLIRRLNRFEYASTVRDLFQFDEPATVRIAELLPDDGTADGFDRIGTALLFDQTQMRKYLELAGQLAARAIVSEGPPQLQRMRYDALQKTKAPPETWLLDVKRFGHKTIHDIVGEKTIPYGPVGYSIGPNGVEVIGLPGYNPISVNAGHPYFLGPGSFDFKVREDGYYRFRFRGAADPGARGEPMVVGFEVYRNVFSGVDKVEANPTVTIEGPLDQVRDYEQLIYLRKPLGEGVLSFRVWSNLLKDLIIESPKYKDAFYGPAGVINKIAAAIEKGRPAEELAALQAELVKKSEEMTLYDGPRMIYNPANCDPAVAPRLLFNAFEIEGPIVAEWPPASHRSILFDGDTRDDEAYLREIFARFLPRAFRRPVDAAEVDFVVGTIASARHQQQMTFHDAVRYGLKLVLCSPAFLYIHEPVASDMAARPLNDYELASRLSYFLWSSMPDETLFDLARQGKLSDPAVLAAQVSRMIGDPKMRRFTENFAGQWLQARVFGSVVPDARAYRMYDEPLESSSKEEVYAFFGHVLEQNLPITNFLDSDFLVINERLARHYGIEGVQGDAFRKVTLRPEHHRGGVLGMAGLLTLLSDGTRTLPVRRGAWILDRLFNDPPPPPPPNAGEIQPATGNAQTVRLRLERHRNEPTCASCHAKIDPLGLALENYDAIGRWRTKSNGERYGDNGPPIDASGELPSGRKFTDLAGYKQALLAEQDKFARNLIEKLLTYALGRPVGYLDKAAVDEIHRKLATDDYRLQTILQGIAASQVFHTK